MRFLALILGIIGCMDAFAATGRAGKINQTAQIVPQTSTNSKVESKQNTGSVPNKASATAGTSTKVAEDPEVKKKEKERDVCRANNIGIGNTFVWAAKDSNTSNYSYMVEDPKDIKNNVCFVKVQMTSLDNRVNLADIPGKYFPMGQKITCGSWVDEQDLTNRILAAKKTGRVAGTVAASVGGAGLGVGAMELFGNKLIGGKVEGQKALSDQELLRSQILVLKKSNQSEYDRIVKALDELETVCNNKALWTGTNKPSDCDAESNPFLGLRDLL